MTQAGPCVCTTLRKTTRAVTRAYDEGLAETGMTITQFAVLRNLDRQGTMALSRLADLLVMDRTSLYRLLTPIERQGWVAIDAGKGRTKQAELTADGRAAMLAATPAWETVQTALIGVLGDADWQALQAHLRVLGDAARDELEQGGLH